jgi:hypothetical protein
LTFRRTDVVYDFYGERREFRQVLHVDIAPVLIRIVATCSADQRIKIFRKAAIDGVSGWELETEWKVRFITNYPIKLNSCSGS